MYEKLEECPSCKGKKFNNYKIIKDHSITGESFAIVKCTTCDLLFTNPRPSEQDIWKYYQSEDYISHSNKTTSIRDLLYKLVRNYTLTQKVQLVKSLNKSPSLLDYGTGTGHFLRKCISTHIKAIGVEPTKQSTIPKRSDLVSKIYVQLKDIPAQDTFDVITAWHVLEHVHKLRSTVKKLKKRLNENGFLIVALPNHNSHDSQYYKEQWAGYDVPRHLYHFDPESFKKFATQLKLKITKTIPMKFDSYYVSMLSEQYNGNRNNLIAGLKEGWSSNKAAQETSQYSSLIYVLQK